MKCETVCPNEATKVVRHYIVKRFQMRVCDPCAIKMKIANLDGNHFEDCPEEEITYGEDQAVEINIQR